LQATLRASAGRRASAGTPSGPRHSLRTPDPGHLRSSPDAGLYPHAGAGDPSPDRTWFV